MKDLNAVKLHEKFEDRIANCEQTKPDWFSLFTIFYIIYTINIIEFVSIKVFLIFDMSFKIY